jgi:SAM-dependent methyltransferase
MNRDIFSEIHQGLPMEGPGRYKYTKKAFNMLPHLDKPRILDIGCGRGGPTLELSRLSQGELIGLDVNQPHLDEFAKKIEQAGLSERVKAVSCSMFEMDLPDESFDIIWSEGSIFIIGFERGLKEWRRFIKPNGFLVVHEMAWLRPDPPEEIDNYWTKIYPCISTIPENLEKIPDCGYSVIGHFALPEDTWWHEYYAPLEKRIQELRVKYTYDSHAIAVLNQEHREIDLYKKYHKWYGSAFFVMQKRDNEE